MPSSPAENQLASCAGSDAAPGTARSEPISDAIRDAIAALESEWTDEAILACERALELDPGCTEAVFLLALVTFDLDEPLRAIELLERAHTRDPEIREYCEALAAIQARLGRVSDALFHAKMATTLAPHPLYPNLLPERFGSFFRNLDNSQPNMYRNRAQRQLSECDFAGAARSCAAQLEITPGEPTTLRLMARACRQAERLEQSVAAGHAVLHGDYPEAEDLSELAVALARMGRTEEADACHRAARDLAPDDFRLHSRYLSDLVRRPDTESEILLSAHAEWSTRHADGIAPADFAPGPDDDPERPLRIGYISGAFFGNDVAELFEPVLRAHDRKGFQIYCYSDGLRRDGVTERLIRLSGKWTDITGIDDETVWQILRGDAIDFAVDLSGHFEGGRPLVFARRPAPVTAAWLGYPCPPGVPTLDAVVTDSVTWPGAARGTLTGEGLWRLARAPFAFRPPRLLPDVEGLPALHDGHLTLGVSCALGLLTPERLRRWAPLFRAVPTARLLVCNRFDHDEACIARLLEACAHLGLRQRVDVVNMADNFDSPFAFYHHIDLALDPGPIDGRTENCRALWMGVPVLSLAGADPSGRAGAALLAAAGHPEWCVETPEELAALVREFDSDIACLAELRTGLRTELENSELADVGGLTRALEDCYRSMWRAWCGGVRERENAREKTA